MLRRDVMTMTTLVKGNIYLGAVFQFRDLVHCRQGRKHGKDGQTMVLERGREVCIWIGRQ